MALVLEPEFGKTGPAGHGRPAEERSVALGVGDGAVGAGGQDQLPVAPDAGEVERVAAAAAFLEQPAERGADLGGRRVVQFQQPAAVAADRRIEFAVAIAAGGADLHGGHASSARGWAPVALTSATRAVQGTPAAS